MARSLVSVALLVVSAACHEAVVNDLDFLGRVLSASSKSTVKIADNSNTSELSGLPIDTKSYAAIVVCIAILSVACGYLAFSRKLLSSEEKTVEAGTEMQQKVKDGSWSKSQPTYGPLVGGAFGEGTRDGAHADGSRKPQRYAKWAQSHAVRFAVAGLVLEAVIIVLLGQFFTYGDQTKDGGIEKMYGMFQDVHVMIFIGFGFLMTFLHHHGFGSVGMNFMVSAYVLQWSMVVHGLVGMCWPHPAVEGAPPADKVPFERIGITMESFVMSDFAAGAALISLGAVIGRVSPLQALFMAVIEIIFYSINEHIVLGFNVVDAGGSMLVHVFGAYFGLAASWAMGRGQSQRLKDHSKNGSSKTSDTFAMVGTLFLFVFWPSFTGALVEGPAKFRTVANTILALAACCSAAFSFTLIVRPEKRFSMVDIQNATLAGGVAIGSVCNLAVEPFGACAVGVAAALLSVVGYSRVQGVLEDSLGLFDTCGVHNLHGMPGVLGGILGAVMAALSNKETYLDEQIWDIYKPFGSNSTAPKVFSGTEQATAQLYGLAITLVIAVVAGVLTGTVLKLPVFLPVPDGGDFEDHTYWEVEGEEELGDDI